MGFLSDLGKLTVSPLWLAADKLTKSPTTVTQEALRTPEQQAAQKALLQFGETGSYGGYTAGQQYGGPFGNFEMSDLERFSQSRLTDLLSSGAPRSFALGESALEDLLTTDKYDPLKSGGAYDLMQGTMDRQIRDATTAAKRNAAYQGNLYSSDAVRQLGDVQAKGVEAKNSLLGSLYQNYIGQRLSAIPQALGAGTASEEMALNRINAGYSAGALPRNLNTAKAQAEYQDFLRQRAEKQGQLTTLSGLSSSNANWGVPSLTLPGQSGWEKLLDIGAKILPSAFKAMGGAA